MLHWKVNDWAVFDLRIVQIKKLEPYVEVSDGSINTSGSILDRLRPLTLRNKAIIEYFAYYYNELRNIRGERGFNYPDISSYFSQLSLDGIDADDNHYKPIAHKARDFVSAAEEYQPIIDGIHLFRDTK